jgi:DNA-binding XRE family transcriptional regulator
MDWATEVKTYRRRHLITQATLAELLDVDTTSISRWERGRDHPSLTVQAKLRWLVAPKVSDLSRSLRDIVETTPNLAVVMDRNYRIVGASSAHRELFHYDMPDVLGVQYPMWTDAMHATMDPIGGPEGWWKNGIYRIEFFAMRKPYERAQNPEILYQKISTVTVRDTHGESYRFSMTQRLTKAQFLTTPPKIETF